MNVQSDAEVIRFFRYHLHPMLVLLYTETMLEVPEYFDWKVEGPRLITALRAQGFDLKFVDKAGKEVK